MRRHHDAAAALRERIISGLVIAALFAVAIVFCALAVAMGPN